MFLHLLLFFVVGFRFLAAGQATTVFVDPACRRKTGLDGTTFVEALNQALTFADSAFQRLSDKTDFDSQRYYDLMFGANNRLPIPDIIETFDQIAGLRPSNNRAQSDIRIICDNDARWVFHEDSNLWLDPMNLMAVRPAPRCRANSIPGQANQVLGSTYNVGVPTQGQPAQRSAITICDVAFQKPNGDQRRLALDDDWFTDGFFAELDANNNRRSVDDLDVLSVTVLHEITHTNSWATKDVRGEDSYGFANVKAMAQGSTDGLTNADSYALFGLMCALKEYTIDDNGLIFSTV